MNDRIEILPDVFLTSVQTDKFKTGCFSINFLRPMARSEASQNVGAVHAAARLHLANGHKNASFFVLFSR